MHVNLLFSMKGIKHMLILHQGHKWSQRCNSYGYVELRHGVGGTEGAPHLQCHFGWGGAQVLPLQLIPDILLTLYHSTISHFNSHVFSISVMFTELPFVIGQIVPNKMIIFMQCACYNLRLGFLLICLLCSPFSIVAGLKHYVPLSDITDTSGNGQWFRAPDRFL